MEGKYNPLCLINISNWLVMAESYQSDFSNVLCIPTVLVII